MTSDVQGAPGCLSLLPRTHARWRPKRGLLAVLQQRAQAWELACEHSQQEQALQWRADQQQQLRVEQQAAEMAKLRTLLGLP